MQSLGRVIAVAVLVINLSVVCHALSQQFMVEMRDGVKLSTMVDFPLFMVQKDNNGGFTIMANKSVAACYDVSPYGHTATEMIADVCLLYNKIAVRQDMRGTRQSGGAFTIWHSAANDSYDTMQWIASQSWSNGEVYGVGASADGLAAFTEAKLQPVWLKKQWTIFASSVGYPVIFGDGMYHQALTEMWMKSTVPQQADRCIKEIISNENPGVWWNALNLTDEYWKVKFPARMWAGWYDIFLVGHLIAFENYQKLSDPSVRGRHQIVIDPLGHCQEGASYFPKNTVLGRVLLPIQQALDFIGDRNPQQNVNATTFYVMSSKESQHGNYWTTLPDFPVFKPMSYYFQTDGSLTLNGYPKPANTSYIYDPHNPVKTNGGNNLNLKCGPLDQSESEQPKRSDVLTYTSEVLSDYVAITGPINAVLYVSSNCTDTDFTVRLTDVYPNGESHLIQDGGVRMRWRLLNQGAVSPTLMTPGLVYRGEISLWNTSYVFTTGHRIRVSITSSNAPRYSVNPNNGLPLIQNGTQPMFVAKNTIYQSDQFPSRIILPTVSLAQMPPTHISMPALDQLAQSNPAEAKSLMMLMEREAKRFGMSLDELHDLVMNQ